MTERNWTKFIVKLSIRDARKAIAFKKALGAFVLSLPKEEQVAARRILCCPEDSDTKGF